jgi:hypothetical protein
MMVFHLYGSDQTVQHFFIHQTEAECRQDVYDLSHNKTPAQVMMEAQIPPEPLTKIDFSCVTLDEAVFRLTGQQPRESEPGEQ